MAISASASSATRLRGSELMARLRAECDIWGDLPPQRRPTGTNAIGRRLARQLASERRARVRRASSRIRVSGPAKRWGGLHRAPDGDLQKHSVAGCSDHLFRQRGARRGTSDPIRRAAGAGARWSRLASGLGCFRTRRSANARRREPSLGRPRAPSSGTSRSRLRRCPSWRPPRRSCSAKGPGRCRAPLLPPGPL